MSDEYVIYRGVVGYEGKVSVQVLKRNGYEGKVPCYAFLKACKNYPDAERLVNELTQGGKVIIE